MLFVDAALSSFSRNGTAISVMRALPSTSNPGQGTVTKNFFPYTGLGLIGKKYEITDSSTVLSTDIKLLFKSATVPEVTDVFTLNNIEYTCMSVTVCQYKGVDLYYTVQLR
jgi:hypothetical protein